MLIVIDNQSSFIKKFKRNYLSEHDFEAMFFDHNQPVIVPKNAEVKGIILSGGKGTPWEPLNLTSNFVAMMNYDVPIIGFCLGFEIIAVAWQGRVKRMAVPQQKMERVTITRPEDPIFTGIDTAEVMLREKHHHCVSTMPRDFDLLGYSEACPIEIFKHKDKPIYGFQSHPEVSGRDGIRIMQNFLNICGLIDDNAG